MEIREKNMSVLGICLLSSAAGANDVIFAGRQSVSATSWFMARGQPHHSTMNIPIPEPSPSQHCKHPSTTNIPASTPSQHHHRPHPSTMNLSRTTSIPFPAPPTSQHNHYPHPINNPSQHHNHPSTMNIPIPAPIPIPPPQSYPSYCCEHPAHTSHLPSQRGFP